MPAGLTKLATWPLRKNDEALVLHCAGRIVTVSHQLVQQLNPTDAQTLALIRQALAAQGLADLRVDVTRNTDKGTLCVAVHNPGRSR